MKITKEQLVELYVRKNLTVRQCAESLGLPTHSGIQWAMKKFGIQARPVGFQVGNRKKGDRPPEKHANWKGGKKTTTCDECGKELKRFPSLIRKINFCDYACRGKWRVVNMIGEKNPNWGNTKMAGDGNPNWQGGIACEPYGPVWVDKRFKAGIRERDNHACQNPGCRKNSDGLTIHHIDYDKKNCEPENLITLCNSCNCRANYNRDFWEAGYRAIIQEKYKQMTIRI